MLASRKQMFKDLDGLDRLGEALKRDIDRLLQEENELDHFRPKPDKKRLLPGMAI